MSEAAKLRKQVRRKKVLDCMDSANRTSYVAHIQQLAVLQQTAADLDDGGQNYLNVRFLDMRTAYRNMLAPQIRGLSEILAVEAERAEVLRRRVENVESDITEMESRIRDSSELDQLLDRLNRNRSTIWTAPRKLGR